MDYIINLIQYGLAPILASITTIVGIKLSAAAASRGRKEEKEAEEDKIIMEAAAQERESLLTLENDYLKTERKYIDDRTKSFIDDLAREIAELKDERAETMAMFATEREIHRTALANIQEQYLALQAQYEDIKLKLGSVELELRTWEAGLNVPQGYKLIKIEE